MELSTQDPSSTLVLSGTSFNDKKNQVSADTFNNMGNTLKQDGDEIQIDDECFKVITDREIHHHRISSSSLPKNVESNQFSNTGNLDPVKIDDSRQREKLDMFSNQSQQPMVVDPN